MASGYVGQNNDPTTTAPVVGEGEDGSTHANPNRATYEELVAAGDRGDMMWYTVFDMETGDVPDRNHFGQHPRPLVQQYRQPARKRRLVRQFLDG